MKFAPRVALLAILMLIVHAEEEAPPEYQLAPQSDFPTRLWKVSDEEEKSWKGDFAPALALLLRHGLPDPLGLPYHRISIYTGTSRYGFEGEIETEGWLMPQKDGEPTFVIAWNGLVYPLVKDLGEADLKKQVASIMQVKEDERASWSDTGESKQVMPGSLCLIHGLYLTRLGYPDAAKYVLENRDVMMKAPPSKEQLAVEWLWNLYERAITAHMRGDPNLSLASIATFKDAASRMEKKLAAIDPKLGNIASWREDIPLMEAECHRRLKSEKVGYFDEKKFAANAKTVEELIDALDRIALPQDGQPGDVPLWESEVVKRLVAMGDSALEPLLSCLEKDMRLTQSVHYWRLHHKSRTVLGVHEAALYALQSILHTGYFELGSTGDSLSARDPEYRRELATVIRKSWEKYGKTTGPARAFNILKDDAAGMEAWIQAGDALLPQVDYDEEKGEYVPRKGPTPGEPLRAFSNPSVSDFLLKRATTETDPNNPDKDAVKRDRLVMYSILLDWDQERGRKAIGLLADAWLKEDSWKQENIGTLQNFILDVVDKAPEILPLFESIAWILPPCEYANTAEKSYFVTDIMSKHAKSLKRRDLWTNPDSPWYLNQLAFGSLQGVIEYWESRDLVNTVPFKEHIRDLLKDESKCGEIYIEKDKPNLWWHRYFGSQGNEIPKDAKLGLKPGESMDLRRKDVVAKVLTQGDWSEPKKEEPIFEYYWPLKDRDECIARLLEKMK